jgi:hypothetical protein
MFLDRPPQRQIKPIMGMFTASNQFLTFVDDSIDLGKLHIIIH